jgi:hypothetical protein|tara:strand:- start:7293 stop:7436 length:144 start_codon:yes stop_codon:yes gene_type:complete
VQNPTDGELDFHHFAESGVMAIETALIGMPDITTRIKPHKDPETSSG